jgi:hypothetical protein
MLKFPYGNSDFYRIQTNHYFYVDRSHYIRVIEETGDQLLFLRPRRFGKSLLLSIKRITTMWQKRQSLNGCLGI